MGQTMSYEQALQKIATSSSHPRVTKEDVQAKIAHTEYQVRDQTTICIMEMKNGFKIIEASTPASPENFKTDVGEALAFQKCFERAWELEGYLLREHLMGEPGAKVTQQPKRPS